MQLSLVLALTLSVSAWTPAPAPAPSPTPSTPSTEFIEIKDSSANVIVKLSVTNKDTNAVTVSKEMGPKYSGCTVQNLRVTLSGPNGQAAEKPFDDEATVAIEYKDLFHGEATCQSFNGVKVGGKLDGFSCPLPGSAEKPLESPFSPQACCEADTTKVFQDGKCLLRCDDTKYQVSNPDATACVCKGGFTAFGDAASPICCPAGMVFNTATTTCETPKPPTPPPSGGPGSCKPGETWVENKQNNFRGCVKCGVKVHLACKKSVAISKGFWHIFSCGRRYEGQLVDVTGNSYGSVSFDYMSGFKNFYFSKTKSLTISGSTAPNYCFSKPLESTKVSLQYTKKVSFGVSLNKIFCTGPNCGSYSKSCKFSAKKSVTGSTVFSHRLDLDYVDASKDIDYSYEAVVNHKYCPVV